MTSPPAASSVTDKPPPDPPGVSKDRETKRTAAEVGKTGTVTHQAKPKATSTDPLDKNSKKMPTAAVATGASSTNAKDPTCPEASHSASESKQASSSSSSAPKPVATSESQPAEKSEKQHNPTSNTKPPTLSHQEATAAKSTIASKGEGEQTTSEDPKTPTNQEARDSKHASTTPQTEPVHKKRKVSADNNSSSSSSPSRAVPVTPHMPLADPVVVQTSHDIMSLLQTYGSLSLEQLEYNLPPIPSSRDSYIPRGGHVVLGPNTLQDIIDVLVATGVVQVTMKKPNTAIPGQQQQQQQQQQQRQPQQSQEPTRLYCMLDGIPRADVIFPSQVLPNLERAIVEETRSRERIVMLQKALAAENKVLAREELKQILLKYPEVVHDPVFVSGLKCMHIDVAAVERDRSKPTTTASTTPKSTRKKPKPAEKSKEKEQVKETAENSNATQTSSATKCVQDSTLGTEKAASVAKETSENETGAPTAELFNTDVDSNTEKKEPTQAATKENTS